VINFEQLAAVKGHGLSTTMQTVSARQESVKMSTADQLWYYADEAVHWARQSKTEKEKLALIELARTFKQAALKKTFTQAAQETAIPNRCEFPAPSNSCSDAAV
jgi:hypothetical protein